MKKYRCYVFLFCALATAVCGSHLVGMEGEQQRVKRGFDEEEATLPQAKKSKPMELPILGLPIDLQCEILAYVGGPGSEETMQAFSTMQDTFSPEIQKELKEAKIETLEQLFYSGPEILNRTEEGCNEWKRVEDALMIGGCEKVRLAKFSEVGLKNLELLAELRRAIVAGVEAGEVNSSELKEVDVVRNMLKKVNAVIRKALLSDFKFFSLYESLRDITNWKFDSHQNLFKLFYCVFQGIEAYVEKADKLSKEGKSAVKSLGNILRRHFYGSVCARDVDGKLARDQKSGSLKYGSGRGKVCGNPCEIALNRNDCQVLRLLLESGYASKVAVNASMLCEAVKSGSEGVVAVLLEHFGSNEAGKATLKEAQPFVFDSLGKSKKDPLKKAQHILKYYSGGIKNFMDCPDFLLSVACDTDLFTPNQTQLAELSERCPDAWIHSKTLRDRFRADKSLLEAALFAPNFTKDHAKLLESSGLLSLNDALVICLKQAGGDKYVYPSVRSLLEAGANPNMQDSAGKPVLFIALEIKKVGEALTGKQLVQELLKHKASVFSCYKKELPSEFIQKKLKLKLGPGLKKAYEELAAILAEAQKCDLLATSVAEANGKQEE